ncbi:ECs1377 family protein [Kluyvera intermedia]|uniref:DNA-binding protein n=1 Tax=Kluyvera intermedia TaxID=61648 RepID=A0ABX6DSW0_KLUIN|nr:helix-turn-helix domain-containing protein [Kluyvera intermedia]QGH30670.1 DNA-binding protein [Kluyvera intermedia]QGH39652.1 DNA-binding protein [Kluyvera intermedia]
MAGIIDYQIEKYSFKEASEPARLTSQWAEVMEECRRMGAEDRLRIALLNVDYVTSFELPFRLLLVRAPQFIASVREELALNQKNVMFNGKRFGCVYSLKTSMDAIPDTFVYSLASRIRRMENGQSTAAPYQEIAKQTRVPRERLKLALEAGLDVTALDALFWFGIQRLAAEVQQLRKTGMNISTAEVDTYDSLTETTRRVPYYRWVKK